MSARPPTSDVLNPVWLRAHGDAHYFGLGFIQIKLDAIWRVHVWTPDWPTIPGAEYELHDHRYAFNSEVLKGALHHELFMMGPMHATPAPDDLECLSVSCQPGEAAKPLHLGYASAIPMGVFQVEAGSAYRLEPDAFHRSFPVAPTVTLLQRGPQIKTMARVMRPQGTPHTCPFSLDRGPEECWAKIETILLSR